MEILVSTLFFSLFIVKKFYKESMLLVACWYYAKLGFVYTIVVLGTTAGYR